MNYKLRRGRGGEKKRWISHKKMYSCYQTVETCYPPPGFKKQGQVQAMRIGRKTKVPARLGFEDNCCNCTWKGTLAPAPTERDPLWLSRCFCCFVVRRRVFWRSGSGDLRHVGMLLFNRNHIKCRRRLNVWHSGSFYLINKIPFNVVLKIKKGGSVAEGM